MTDTTAMEQELEDAYAALRWVYENGVKTDYVRPPEMNDIFNESFASHRIGKKWAPDPRQSAPDSAQAERMASHMGFNSLDQAMWKLSAFMKGKDSALVVSKDTFRAKTMIELKGAIYDAHGWRRQAGESMGKRVAEHFDVVLDHSRGDFVARRKATPTTQAEPVSDDVRAQLKTAITHIEHMAAFIGKQKAGYSFESLGEDMPAIKAALSRPDGGTPFASPPEPVFNPSAEWVEQYAAWFNGEPTPSEGG